MLSFALPLKLPKQNYKQYRFQKEKHHNGMERMKVIN